VSLSRLTNEQWGFSSNCYVCAPQNSVGLRLPFFHDSERDCVVVDLLLGEEYSGAPSYVHGGVTLAILDEAMAWAAIAVGGKFAVTRETSTAFDFPVRVGREYRVEARLTERGEKEFRAEAVVLDVKGRPCVRAHCTLVVLSEAHAVDAIGEHLSDDDAKFVR
jgi:acyl-coenzyme A thioesterase PaaI-like protein